jgi:hypothetical protein
LCIFSAIILYLVKGQRAAVVAAALVVVENANIEN